jgi:hypothetical protein
VRRLKQLLTTAQAEITPHELKAVAQKIEGFLI